jgi:hypothetical protein
MRARLAAVSAVSDPEKKADAPISTKMMRPEIQILLSIGVHSLIVT